MGLRGMSKMQLSEYSNTFLYINELIEVFKTSNDKRLAHQKAKEILRQMTSEPEIIKELLTYNINQEGFLARKHYPVVDLPIYRNPDFHLVANCWLPLPSKDTSVSTKSLHHHGPMLLTSVTAFGPGYEHWLFEKPVLVDEQNEVFSMKLIERSPHPIHHICFVDSYTVHVPMYISELTITYALWSNSYSTSFLDKIKANKFISKNKKYLKSTVKSFGFKKTLNIKSENYLDFCPVIGGFKGIKERSEVEFLRGPKSDYLYSLFHIIQKTGNSDVILNINKDHLFSNNPGLTLQEQHLINELINDLKRGQTILSRLTKELHYGFPHANFTNESILKAIETQPQ